MYSIYTKSNNINYKDINLVNINLNSANSSTFGTYTFDQRKLINSTFSTNVVFWSNSQWRFDFGSFNNNNSEYATFEVTVDILIESDQLVSFVEITEVGNIDDPTIIIPVYNQQCFYKFDYMTSKNLTNGYLMVFRIECFDETKNQVIPTNITGTCFCNACPLI